MHIIGCIKFLRAPVLYSAEKSHEARLPYTAAFIVHSPPLQIQFSLHFVFTFTQRKREGTIFVPKLSNDITDVLYSTYGPCKNVEDQLLLKYKAVIEVFEKLQHTSPFCRFLVRTYAEFWDIGFDNDNDDEVQARAKLPSSFLLEFMLETGRLRKMSADGKKSEFPKRCEYHEHTTEEKKQACRRNWRIETAAAKAAKRARDEEKKAIGESAKKKQKPT